MEITLKDLWVTLKKSLVLMLVFALLFGTAFYVYNSRFATKVYSSSSEFILLAKATSIEDEEELNNYLVVGVRAIPTLQSILMSEVTMESVLRHVKEAQELEPDNADWQLDGSYSAAGLLGSFSFQCDETLVFTVRCRATSSKDSRVLLQAFAEIINERSEKVLCGVFEIEQSRIPTNGSKVSPNVGKNTLLGAVVGAVLTYVAVLIVSVLDTRVKREKDLKARFAQFPVLGQIPHIGD